MVDVTSSRDGVRIPVYVQPGASRNRLCGDHDGRLKVAVTARPEKGKANDALCRLLASELGISRTRVHVVSGLTARRKEVFIERVGADALEAIIA